MLEASKGVSMHLSEKLRVRSALLMVQCTLVLLFIIVLSSCGSGGQQQAQPTDPRLKAFHILSSRIIIKDTQAEVDGTVQNTGHDRFPYDVTIVATFYDGSGNMIGHAQGVAEDVSPGTIRPFVLKGQVDSARYSHMTLASVS